MCCRRLSLRCLRVIDPDEVFSGHPDPDGVAYAEDWWEHSEPSKVWIRHHAIFRRELFVPVEDGDGAYAPRFATLGRTRQTFVRYGFVRAGLPRVQAFVDDWRRPDAVVSLASVWSGRTVFLTLEAESSLEEVVPPGELVDDEGPLLDLVVDGGAVGDDGGPAVGEAGPVATALS